MKIAASEVRVAGTGGVLLYEGTAEADREGNIVVAPQGKIELSAEDGERAIHNRGKEVTYYLAWEHEDLSHPSNRYRDAPQQKDYDWMKLGTHVAAGLMIAGGIAALAAGGVLLLGAAAATAIKIGMTVFLAGSLYVGEQALSDIRSGRVSDLDQYTRKAVAGSVVGFLTGASGLLMAEASLLGVLALGFGEGLVGSIVTQKLLNEDGEIVWGVAIAEAGFSAVTAGFAWKEGRSVRGGGGEAAGIVDNPKEVNIHGKINSEIDEVDLINKIIYEDKSVAGLYMDNPDFPQTEAQWAYKQIYKKGSNRINALQQSDFTLSGAGSLPDVKELKGIKDYVFRMDADTPGLRAAVQKELDNLKATFPDYNFSAVYGGKK